MKKAIALFIPVITLVIPGTVLAFAADNAADFSFATAAIVMGSALFLGIANAQKKRVA